MELSELIRKLYKIAAGLNLYFVLYAKTKTDDSRIINELAAIENLLHEIKKHVEVTTDKG